MTTERIVMKELERLELIDHARKDHDLVLFALSTCPWCGKARTFLDDNDLAYHFVYVDLLEGTDRDEVIAVIRELNPRMSFPTLVIDESDVIKGFEENTYTEKLL